MYLQIALQVLLPGFLIFSLWRSRFQTKFEWLVNALIIGLVLIFLYLTLRWDFTSYYLRILLLPVFLLACYIAYRKSNSDEPFGLTRQSFFKSSLNILIIVLLTGMNISVLGGYFYQLDAVDLSYPLRDGVYYVGGGGHSRWINNHVAAPPQDYALDIVRLNGFGYPASGIAPVDLEKYAIYGDTIYSPCDGDVIRAVDGNVDQIPPQRDLINVAGNYVLVACHNVTILLAHMQQGSVAVAEGEQVNAGTVLGKVGNSGNSSQPHLHIHAERGGELEEILDGEGVPITFQGRFLVRNSLITGNK